MTLTKEKLLDVESQMFNKARDIDVALFNTYLDTMPKEFVYSALMMYQNKDGGLGHGLDPDNLNPNSTVYQTCIGLMMLKQAGFCSYHDDEDVEVFLNKIFNYLYNKKPIWSLYDSENLKYACAERFRHESDDMFLSSSIVGYTISFLDDKKPYYKKALAKLDYLFRSLLALENATYDELLGYKILLDALTEKGIRFDGGIKDKLRSLEVAFFHSLEINETNYYYAPMLDADYALEKSFDVMISSLKHHGLWEELSSWGNDYPEGESAKLKWLGCRSAQNIYLLKKYRRIEE